MTSGTVPVMDFAHALYAAVTAVEEGKIAEAEVIHRITDGDREEMIEVTLRREVRQFLPIDKDE